MELHNKTIHQLSDMLKNKEVTSVELTQSFIDKSSADEYITATFDAALETARLVDAKTAKGEEIPVLAGIPYALSDSICTNGVATTCGSKILENFIPPYDAFVVHKLKQQSAPMLGKLKMKEFGSGVVKYGEGVNLKPTYGLVSRAGLVAFASSMDRIEISAANIYDCAVVLGAIAGVDKADTITVDTSVPDYFKALQNDAGVNVGVLGKDFELKYGKYAPAAHYIISSAEASSNLACYDGIRFGRRAESYDDLYDLYKKSRSEGFGDEVQKQILFGTYVLSAGQYEKYYKKALQVRTLIRSELDEVLSKYDVITADDAAAADLAGLPVLTAGDKMLVGKAFDEATLLRAANY